MKTLNHQEVREREGNKEQLDQTEDVKRVDLN